jgi:hypothetical protein
MESNTKTCGQIWMLNSRQDWYFFHYCICYFLLLIWGIATKWNLELRNIDRMITGKVILHVSERYPSVQIITRSNLVTRVFPEERRGKTHWMGCTRSRRGGFTGDVNFVIKSNSLALTNQTAIPGPLEAYLTTQATLFFKNVLTNLKFEILHPYHRLSPWFLDRCYRTLP